MAPSGIGPRRCASNGLGRRGVAKASASDWPNRREKSRREKVLWVMDAPVTKFARIVTFAAGLNKERIGGDILEFGGIPPPCVSGRAQNFPLAVAFARRASPSRRVSPRESGASSRTLYRSAR